MFGERSSVQNTVVAFAMTLLARRRSNRWDWARHCRIKTGNGCFWFVKRLNTAGRKEKPLLSISTAIETVSTASNLTSKFHLRYPLTNFQLTNFSFLPDTRLSQVLATVLFGSGMPIIPGHVSKLSARHRQRVPLPWQLISRQLKSPKILEVHPFLLSALQIVDQQIPRRQAQYRSIIMLPFSASSSMMK